MSCAAMITVDSQGVEVDSRPAARYSSGKTSNGALNFPRWGCFECLSDSSALGMSQISVEAEGGSVVAPFSGQ